MKDMLKELFAHYKPIWMFWNPGSGLLGGLIFGLVIVLSVLTLGVLLWKN